MHDSDVPVPAVPVPDGPDSPAADDITEAAWLAGVYDSFAEALYAYCRLLVREPAIAADAVQDTFVVAASRRGELPEDGLLRAWLHAVARNECLRAIARGRATPAQEFLSSDSGAGGPFPGASSAAFPAYETGADVVTGDSGSPEGTQGAEVRALLGASLGGLEPAEQDFMTMTWHGLDVAECSAVLGITQDEASKVLFRARDQLETSAGVMTVTRSASHECGQLNDMLAGWDGQLTPVLHTDLRQHIDHCDICADQRRTGMRPAILLRLAPDTLRGMSVGTSPLTAWVTSRLREQVLEAAFGSEPESFGRRAMVVRRSGPYRDDGFPAPLDPSGTDTGRRRRPPASLVLAGLGGAGLLAVAVIAGLALSGNHSAGALPSWAGLAQSATSSAGIGNASPASAPRARVSPSPHRSTATPATTLGSKSPSAASRPSATARPTSSKSATPTTSSAPLASARVSVSPGSLQLAPAMNGGYAGWLTLSNRASSDMSWSMSLPPTLATWGNVTSGTLRPGASTRLLIYTTWGGRHGHESGQSQTETITLQPGSVQVTVTIP